MSKGRGEGKGGWVEAIPARFSNRYGLLDVGTFAVTHRRCSIVSGTTQPRAI